MSLLESISPSKLEKLNSPAASALAMGLRYVADEMPGIRREHSGKGFRYRYPTGELVSDPAVLQRIKALVVPPAWTRVWICPDPCGHLQATGRDDRGRKQNRYHPRWREVRDEAKYARMIAFGRALAKIRKRVNRDLALPGLPRNKVLATVVRLLDRTLIRVGNDEYARENESFGLTTLRNRHVRIDGSELRFHFKGKSGKTHEVDVHDLRVARVVQKCQELPGQELFQYLDAEEQRRAVRSEDVNEYLRETSGNDFTAKDFRTWAGTVLAARALLACPEAGTKALIKKNVVKAIERVAQKLGNTVAVCRKCYVHPEVLSAYSEGTLSSTLKECCQAAGSPSRLLRVEEAAVLKFLKQRLAGEKIRLQRQLRQSLRQHRALEEPRSPRRRL